MSEPRKKRGAYGTGRATKEAILVAATGLFGEKGYYGFSLRDVAKIVGVSHPAIIYHFPTKEALLYSTASRWHREIGLFGVSIHPGSGEVTVHDDELRLASVGLALLRLGMREDFELMARFDLTMVAEGASPEHPLHDFYHSRVLWLHRLVDECLPGLVADGWCAPNMNSEAVARALFATWYGVIAERSNQEEPMDGQGVVGYVFALVSQMLHFDSEHLLAIASAVPEDLAAPFQRALRVSREVAL